MDESELISIEYSFEFSISFIAFRMIIELPPAFTPISTIFLGLQFVFF